MDFKFRVPFISYLFSHSDGRDGDLVVNNGQTVTIPSGSFKQYRSVTINFGGVLKVDNGVGQMTYIGVQYDLINNGTINSSASGAHTNATIVGRSLTGEVFSTFITQSEGGIGGNGNAGGSGGNPFDGNGGGGGGGRGQYESGNFVNSGGATATSSGGGKGGNGGRWNTTDHPSQIPGGAGALIYGQNGTQGGQAGPSENGSGGGGGGSKGYHGQSIIIFAKNILGNGLINANGGNGGNGGNSGPTSTGWNTGAYLGGGRGGGGGGGAGGSAGNIYLRYKEVLSSNLTYSVVGGSGGLGGSNNGGGQGNYFGTAGTAGNSGQNGTVYFKNF